MRRLHVDIVFPPVHDPALPHISGPLLKASLRAKVPDASVSCVDLNQQFFATEVFGPQYPTVLREFRSRFRSSQDASAGVRVAVEFDAQIRRWCGTWRDGHPGHGLSFRYYSCPDDRRSPAAVARAARHSTVFDSVLLRYLEASRADIIGIGLTVEDQIIAAARLAALAREARPGCSLVWGGNLLSRIYPGFDGPLASLWDWLVIKEGEEPFAAIVQGIRDGARTTPSDGRVLDHARIKHTVVTRPFPRQPLPITDITGIPEPDFSDLPVHEYCSLVPMLPVLTGRKCYWGRCDFCTIHRGWDDAARLDTPERVFAVVSGHVKRYGIRHFRFVDEASSPEILEPLCRMILNSDLTIGFEIYAIAERRFCQGDLVELLGQAGCRQVYFGVESADGPTLRMMNKGINRIERYPVIFERCAAAGIHVYAYALLGYPEGGSVPGEQATVDYLVSEHNVHTLTIGSFVPVVGSPFADRHEHRLVHTGGMTEDYSMIRDDTGKEVPVGELGREPVRNALELAMDARPDLALTSLLNDEMRFALSDGFGPRFAQDMVRVDGVDSWSGLRGTAVSQACDERIDRALPNPSARAMPPSSRCHRERGKALGGHTRDQV